MECLNPNNCIQIVSIRSEHVDIRQLCAKNDSYEIRKLTRKDMIVWKKSKMGNKQKWQTVK